MDQKELTWTSNLQFGHVKSPRGVTKRCKHSLQKVWRHGSALASLIISQHIEHVTKSARSEAELDGFSAII